MKRLLSLLVVIAMVVSLIPNVFAAKEEIDMDELLGRLVVLEDISGFTATLAEGSDGMIYQWTPAADETAESVALYWTAPEGTVINVTATTGETTVAGENGELTLPIVAGQLVEIEIAEATGLAAEFNVSGILAYPVGTETNPIVLGGPVDEVTIEKASWFQLYFVGDVEIVGEGAFNVICNGETVAAVDGKATIAVAASRRAPAVFQIDAAGTYTITQIVPVGSMENPAALVIGENVADIKAGAQGYFFTWIATEEGTLKITMPEGNWSYTINNMTTYQYGDTQWSDIDPVVNPAEIAVAAGDEIQVIVNTYDPANPWEAPAGQLTIKAELVLPEPPAPSLVITSQPESVTAEVGDVVTFTVVAEGEGLTYQWQYRNAGAENWYNTGWSGAQTATLTTAAVTTGLHGRQFRCVITDASGNVVESEPATLTVPYLKVDSATAFGVPVNTDHVFTVEYTVSEGVTYQWQYKGNTSASTWQNTGLTGNKTNALTVNALSTRNGYQYRCIINDNGTEIVSKAAILYVATAPAVVLENPVDASAVCGDKVTFTIEATGTGMEYQWQWYHAASDNWIDTHIAGHNTNTLVVTTNNFNGGRQYRCRLRTVNGSGWNEVYTEAATMTVLPAAEITEPLPETVTVKVGETVQLHLGATGAGLNYQWQYAKYVGSWSNTTLEGAKTDTLTIANVRADLNGRYYRVYITNQYGGYLETAYVQLIVEE